jgi:2-hydroxychromene-2-carboxylate isomerase
LAHGFLRACWAEEKDIADDTVVRACLEAAGFDPDLANSGLLEGAETYAANLEEAVSRGVFGSPFYITGEDHRFWGQDRLEDLDAHLAGSTV